MLLTITNQLGNKLNHMVILILIFVAVSGGVFSFIFWFTVCVLFCVPSQCSLLFFSTKLFTSQNNSVDFILILFTLYMTYFSIHHLCLILLFSLRNKMISLGC